MALAALDEPAPPAPQETDDLPLQLSWSAPATCPSASRVRAEVGRRVDRADQGQASERIVADVEIRTTASGSFQLSLRTTIGDRIGERELSGSDCNQLADAAALVLALLIRPPDALAPEPPPRRPSPEVAAAPAPAAPANPPAWPSRFAVGLGGVVGHRVLPGFAQGMDLRFVLQSTRWAATIRAVGFLGQGSEAPILPGAHATFHRYEGVAAACVRAWPDRRAGAEGCVGGALVRVSGESAGVASSGSAVALWPEGLAEISLHVRVARRARLRLSLEGRALGRAPDFAIRGLGSVYRPASASLRGALGIDVLF